MLVVIKSAFDTPEGKRAIELAKEMSADVCLIQNAVYFIQAEGSYRERLEGFSGELYALEEDIRLRGLNELKRDVRIIDYDNLIDLMIEHDKIIGVF